jgi:hypothetical protein
MWNVKSIYLFLAVCLAFFTVTPDCAKKGGKKEKTNFEFVWADKYFVPPADETVAILLHKWPTKKEDFNSPLALFGNKEQTEKIMGRQFEPEKLFRDRNLLKKITDAYRDALKEAEEEHFEGRGGDSCGMMRFITPTKGYFRAVGIDEDTVHDYYMESEQLKKYFDELGLTNELAPAFRLIEASNYRLPSTDKVVAILLYPQYLGQGRDDLAALIGDKKLAEKLIGKPFKPKKLIEEQSWLIKITDAYKTALNEAKEKNFYHKGYKRTFGRIIFVTDKNGYDKSIGIDANIVYDKYMESKILKKYFDELGITDEMGRSKFKFDFMGWNDVLKVNEIKAILLYPYPLINNVFTPFALIGDKKATEKIMGISIEPEKIIEDRDWLVKIIDAYENVRKEVKENKSYLNFGGDNQRWQIIFVTANKGYEDSIYDQYMESEPLKKYFDELGLTKELLVGEPNKEN